MSGQMRASFCTTPGLKKTSLAEKHPIPEGSVHLARSEDEHPLRSLPRVVRASIKDGGRILLARIRAKCAVSRLLALNPEESGARVEFQGAFFHNTRLESGRSSFQARGRKLWRHWRAPDGVKVEAIKEAPVPPKKKPVTEQIAECKSLWIWTRNDSRSKT